MILTGHEIMNQMDKDNIVIKPFFFKQLNPNSYNLRLGDELLEVINNCCLPHGYVIDPHDPGEAMKVDKYKNRWILEPGKLYLASTMEYTETHRHVPMLEGRSSAARQGISCHITAGVGDIGFCGHWTLEITVVKPTILRPGDQICQIMYHSIQGEILDTYKSGYTGQTGPRVSKGI